MRSSFIIGVFVVGQTGLRVCGEVLVLLNAWRNWLIILRII
jgi:hypothetical protein